MRCALRVAVVTLVLVLATATPVSAKGPARATIRGPGLDAPIVVTWRTEGAARFSAFVEDSGFFNGLWCEGCRGSLTEPPSGSLGARYVVTYSMSLPGTRRSRVEHVVQLLYPFAEPRAVSFVASGQGYWSEHTVGGWSLTRPGFGDLVRSIGVEPPERAADPTPTATSTSTTSPPGAARSFGAVGGAFLGVLAFGIAAVSIVRRGGRRFRRASPRAS